MVGLLAGGLYYYFSKQTPERSEIPTEQLLTEDEITQNKVWYIIKAGPEDIRKYQIEVLPNSTVFSLLEELAAKKGFEIEITFWVDIGVFIESIDGFVGGTDKKWWQYWVNGKLGEVAADRKKVESGDLIEWKFEVPPEFW